MSTWNAPDEPGAEVTHVRDQHGVKWHREDGFWCAVGDDLAHDHRSWWDLLRRGPLTDASGEATR